MAPPKASPPKSTGTTPLYTSMRLAKLAGILLILKLDDTPSIGTPSMNSFTCFPVNPLRFMLVPEPRPPSSRTFTPGTRSRTCAKSRLVLRKRRVSTAKTLNADELTRFTWLPRTTTSSRCWTCLNLSPCRSALLLSCRCDLL